MICYVLYNSKVFNKNLQKTVMSQTYRDLHTQLEQTRSCRMSGVFSRLLTCKLLDNHMNQSESRLLLKVCRFICGYMLYHVASSDFYQIKELRRMFTGWRWTFPRGLILSLKPCRAACSVQQVGPGVASRHACQNKFVVSVKLQVRGSLLQLLYFLSHYFH